MTLGEFIQRITSEDFAARLVTPDEQITGPRGSYKFRYLLREVDGRRLVAEIPMPPDDAILQADVLRSICARLEIARGASRGAKEETAVLIRLDLDAQLAWRAFRDRQTGRWIAECPDLGLTALGDSWHDLQEYIDDLMQSVLLGMLQEGSLDSFLRSHGWRQVTPIPQHVPPEQLRFDVPYELLVERAA